jgi:hypothetical protein
MESTFLLDGWQVITAIAILCIAGSFMLLLVAGLILPQVRRARLQEAELKLKRELIAAGHSADDIVRIVQASGNGNRCATFARPADRGPGREVRPAARDAIRAEY